MRSSSETRRAARTALSGNWGNAVLVTLITIAISFGISYLLGFIVGFIEIIGISTGATAFAVMAAPGAAFAGVSAIVILVIAMIAMFLVTFLITSNLQVGNALFSLNLVTGQRSDISNLFEPFKRGFTKPFKAMLLVELKVLLWLFAGYIPGVVLITLSALMFGSTDEASIILGTVMLTVGILLAIFGIVLAVVASFRYVLTYIVIAENPSLRARDAVRRSTELMRGHKVDYFVLNISFIGWAILASFTCGIGTLFLAPYMNAALAVFYCDLTAKPVVGDMAYFDAMHRSGGYNPNNGYNPNGYNPNGYNPNGYNPNNGYTPDNDAQGNLPEAEQNTENGDNPTQNN